MLRPILISVFFLSLAACQMPFGKETEQTPVVPAAVVSDEERALLTQADTARALGRTDEATALYERAAAMQGGVRAHLELAGLYRAGNRPQEALNILEQAYALSPGNAEVMKEYAQQLLRMNQDDKARDIALLGLTRSPEDVRLMNALGVSFDRAGEHTLAQERYLDAMEVLSGTVDREYTVNNLGLSYVASGDYDKAIALVEPEVTAAANQPALRQLLALAYGAKGDADKAYELGLIDLNVQQVGENLEFYRALRAGDVDATQLFKPVQSR